MSWDIPLPHGGTLVNRVASPDSRETSASPALPLDASALNDLDQIAIGTYSPLTGFMGTADYESVLQRGRLASGTIWTVPVVLPVAAQLAEALEVGGSVSLARADGSVAGQITVAEVFERDPLAEAEAVYGTQDPSHPGVARVLSQSRVLVAGDIVAFPQAVEDEFTAYRFTPAQTRAAFRELGWRQVAGFQTRNPIHRAHEYIIKGALEVTDGVFVNPLVGETKAGDITARVRLACYERLLDGYFPPGRAKLGVYGGYMRYAGPKEAVFHALVRKNFGCSHFIVGRDHAGVGSFYGPYEAQDIFRQYDIAELGITPLFFENSFHCGKCEGMATDKTCPHGPEMRVSLSGTKVRELLAAGEVPPPEFTRPEIADILMDACNQGNLEER